MSKKQAAKPAPAIFNAAAIPDWDAVPEIAQRRDDLDFQRTLDALIKDAEAERMRYMKAYQTRGFMATTLSLILATAGAGGFGWFLLMQGNLPKAAACVLLAIVIPTLFHSWQRRVLDRYIVDYKLQFMPRVAKAMGGLSFYPLRGIGESVLRKSGILPDFLMYDAEDCFAGRHKNMKVLFCEAGLYAERRAEKEVFRGLLVLLEMPQERFTGHTIITADGLLARNFSGTRWQNLQNLKIPVADDAWNMFEIYTDAPDQAKTMVSDLLLKELAETSVIFKKSPLSVALLAKKYVFMAIPCAQDMFEPSSIFVPVTNKHHSLMCKREVHRILEIIDVFDVIGRS